MTNPLAGKPLDYLIGRTGEWDGTDGRVTELPYDCEKAPSKGIGIKYCNLFDETNSGKYGPYLDGTDTSEAYGEGVIDPNGEGWDKNLIEQYHRATAQGFDYIELDNADAYDAVHVLRAIALAESHGLKVIAKNPGLMDGGVQIVAHPNVYGIIVEYGAGPPSGMHSLRTWAEKPELPVWFVFYGDERPDAEATAFAIQDAQYPNMSVTYSSEGEYGNAIHILFPSKPQGPIMPDGAAILKKARSFIGLLHDGPDVPTLADAVSDRFPDLEKYTDLAGPATAWCGIYVAYILASFGIRPPHKDDGVGGFMYVDSWKDWGTEVPVGLEKPGDIALWLGSPHHISFVAGAGRFVGGNQSDGVSEASYRRPDMIRRARAAVPEQPMEPGWSSGKGSWYSQYSGKYEWVDTEDEPGSNKLGVPDDEQGVAFPENATLGKWFDVKAPNGRVLLLQQTDIGPHPSTGRKIDIAAVSAEHFGYSPSSFPTDSIFNWRPAEQHVPAPPVFIPNPQPVPAPAPVPIPPAPSVPPVPVVPNPLALITVLLVLILCVLCALLGVTLAAPWNGCRATPPPPSAVVQQAAPVPALAPLVAPPKPWLPLVQPKAKPKPDKPVKSSKRDKPAGLSRPTAEQCAQIARGIAWLGRAGTIAEAKKRGYSEAQTEAAIKACGHG